eukprot:231618-Chlamydomonas_euryale.AAC.1
MSERDAALQRLEASRAEVASLNAQVNELAKDNMRCIGAAKDAEAKVGRKTKVFGGAESVGKARGRERPLRKAGRLGKRKLHGS